jgi:DNA-binding response OmpR family regulator
MALTQRLYPKVLVVDDDNNTGRALMSLLRNAGFDALAFATAAPALDYLQKNKPDVAILDIHMPDLSGLEISRKLRDTHGDGVPIIIFSGDSSIDTLKAISDFGATLFLRKPVQFSRILEQLKKWTGLESSDGPKTSSLQNT